MKKSVIFILLCTFSTLLFGQEFSEYRFQIASGTNVKNLVDTAREVEFFIDNFKSSEGKKIVISHSDFHVVFDIPIEYIIMVFEDQDRQVEIVPRLMEYEYKILSEGPPLLLEQTQLIGIDFMGVSATYYNLLLTEMGERNSNTKKSYGIRWTLIDSLDDKLKANDGSWYVEEVIVDGRRMTYIRNLNISQIQDTFFGLEFTLKSFAPSDTKKMFDAIKKDALKRMP
jgi:hypothetical protein